ncbi:hypothetical protein OEZ86_007188 [Tetradesmus obliquus]|nr:hypothetical protein OEZ86_007188 [Tetradesmus obliquus]
MASLNRSVVWAEGLKGSNNHELESIKSISWAVLSRDAADPAAASMRLWEAAFRRAKLQLDQDLQQFIQELQQAVASQQQQQQQQDAGDEGNADKQADCSSSSSANSASSSTRPLRRLLQIVLEFPSLSDAAFQDSLPDIISWLHGQRKSCSPHQARLKSCYSRLLFLLSRCSQLVSNGSGGRERPYDDRDGVPAAAAAGGAAGSGSGSSSGAYA